MLEFKQNDTAAELILTLTEFVSIANPYFLFVFTHVLTKETVAFIAADTSLYPSRYNQFTINAAVKFSDKPPGEWHYKIYEQASSSNVDPDLSGAILEYGKMILNRTTDFAYNMYEIATSYKAYNG